MIKKLSEHIDQSDLDNANELIEKICLNCGSDDCGRYLAEIKMHALTSEIRDITFRMSGKKSSDSGELKENLENKMVEFRTARDDFDKNEPICNTSGIDWPRAALVLSFTIRRLGEKNEPA